MPSSTAVCCRTTRTTRTSTTRTYRGPRRRFIGPRVCSSCRYRRAASPPITSSHGPARAAAAASGQARRSSCSARLGIRLVYIYVIIVLLWEKRERFLSGVAFCESAALRFFLSKFEYTHRYSDRQLFQFC